MYLDEETNELAKKAGDMPIVIMRSQGETVMNTNTDYKDLVKILSDGILGTLEQLENVDYSKGHGIRLFFAELIKNGGKQ